MEKNTNIELVIHFVRMIIDHNLVVYNWGPGNARIGSPNYHVGTPFKTLPWKRQFKLAERMLREYRHSELSDKEFVEQCSANPFWVLSFLYGEVYARELVNGGEYTIIDEDDFFAEECCEKGIDDECIIDEDAFYKAS